MRWAGNELYGFVLNLRAATAWPWNSEAVTSRAGKWVSTWALTCVLLRCAGI